MVFRFISVIVLSIFIVGCQAVSPKTFTTISGESVSSEGVPALGVLRKDGVQKALSNRAFLAIPENPLCPRAWGYGPTKSEAEHYCDSAIANGFPDILKHLQSGCDCNIALSPKGKLLVPVSELENPYRHAPITFLIESNSGEKNFFRGIVEFEKDGVGSQQVSFFNNEGALLCEGVANFQKLNKGSFDLSCFNGTLSSNGVASLEKVGSRMVHSVGSGLFSNGDKFVFVTGLRGSYIRELYPEYFADLPHF